MFCEFDKGFPIGTFDIGDKVYCVFYKEHMFRERKECPYCDKKGTIEYKGAIFECPKCKGETQLVEIKEKIIKDLYKIKSKITMMNDIGSKEIYYTDNNFLGFVIGDHKNDDMAHYYKSKEDAQKECDIWNEVNGTYEKLKLYNIKEV